MDDDTARASGAAAVSFPSQWQWVGEAWGTVTGVVVSVNDGERRVENRKKSGGRGRALLVAGALLVLHADGRGVQHDLEFRKRNKLVCCQACARDFRSTAAHQ